MKQRIVILTLLFSIINVCARAEDARYTMNVANFNALTVVDGIGVDYHCNADSAGWVVFTADPDLASKISFTNNKEHLRIQTLADEQPLAGHNEDRQPIENRQAKSISERQTGLSTATGEDHTTARPIKLSGKRFSVGIFTSGTIGYSTLTTAPNFCLPRQMPTAIGIRCSRCSTISRSASVCR